MKIYLSKNEGNSLNSSYAAVSFPKKV